MIPATAAEDPIYHPPQFGFNRLERRNREHAERLALEAQRERESAFWQQKEAERLAIVRAEHYATELAEMASRNDQIQQLEAKKSQLNQSSFDIKRKMLAQPHDVDAILELASELPSLKEALPLLAAEIERCEGSHQRAGW